MQTKKYKKSFDFVVVKKNINKKIFRFLKKIKRTFEKPSVWNKVNKILNFVIAIIFKHT